MSDREDLLFDIVVLGAHMREAQKRYFKVRTLEALQFSKQLEREFDAKAQAAIKQQGELP